MKKFLSYYAPYKVLFTVDFLSAVIVGLLELAFPVIVSTFIDELLLGIGTLLLASFRKRKDPAVNAQDPLRKPPIEGERVQ